MDSRVMELRLKEWMPIFEEQAKSGLNKQDWCEQNGIKRAAFFKWQRECRAYLLSKQELVAVDKEPAFVEISCTQNEADISKASVDANPVMDSSSIVIACKGFSISVNGTVDEMNLAKVLKVISYVH